MISRKRRLQMRRAAKRWRENHPVLDAWRCHRWNAKKRGIPVEWDLWEFCNWCRHTGYHILRKDGYVIHRPGDTGPYNRRCRCIPATVNRRMEAVNVKKAKYRAWREKCCRENLQCA